MSSTESTHDRPPRRRTPLIAAVAAVVLIAGGGSAYFATAGFGANGDGGDRADAKSGAAGKTPPRLAIDPGQGQRESARIAPGEPDPSGRVLYEASGELPAGPERAPVYRATGTVSADEAARLAEALKLPGAPRSAGQEWTIGSGGDGTEPLLRITEAAPGAWTYVLSPRGDDCHRGKDCPEGDGGASDTGAPPSERAAKEAAAPVLKALGQADARLDARQTIGSVRVVNADPVVGGLPTYGWSTDLQIGADGRVVRAAGNLKQPEKGDEYPVLSAADTLDRLNAGPGGDGDSTAHTPGCAPRLPGAGDSGAQVPCGPEACASAAPLKGAEQSTERTAEQSNGQSTGQNTGRNAKAEANPCRGGTSPVPPSARKKVEVTEASFALSSQFSDGRQTLVPSWLFRAEPRGGMPAYTVVEPAVEPSYLREPSVPPKEPTVPQDPPPSETPSSGDSRILSYSAEGRSLTVAFWGGVCGEYRATASESGDRVTVRIVEPELKPGENCIALAKEIKKTVTLAKPLGNREVVDADSGKRVAPAGG
ncbi:hypothetical protein [Streptomyces sp. NPDC014894]|uniref:hypothetical protein n=1 Tax=Streptomyces sp. NPDC014894 TaxID=3364931 RepID=UPI003700515F